MTTPTKNYGLTKPDVGGSENEWGGLLNGDLDEIDALLGGDSPINGINIESGTIDGSTIEGTIDNVVLGPDNEISGKVGTLTGDDSSTISGCDITAKKLGVQESITEAQHNLSTADETVNPTNGTMQYHSGIDPAQKFTISLLTGQSVTLAFYWADANNPPAITWNVPAGTAIQWVGGGSPDVNQGINIVQFWCMNFGAGPVVCGAYTGVVS